MKVSGSEDLLEETLDRHLVFAVGPFFGGVGGVGKAVLGAAPEDESLRHGKRGHAEGAEAGAHGGQHAVEGTFEDQGVGLDIEHSDGAQHGGGTHRLAEQQHSLVGPVSTNVRHPGGDVLGFVKADGGDILFCTIEGRRKTANMQRDPRVSLLVHSLPGADEITYAVISGSVEFTDDPDGAFHEVMYGLYMGGATPPPEPGAQRLIARLRAKRIYALPSF